MPSIQAVDLSRINALVEIVVRAGNTSVPSAHETLQKAYHRYDSAYRLYGLSTLFRPGATLDDLAREGAFDHKKLGFSVIGKLQTELIAVGCTLVLFHTPTDVRPDHHTLCVATGDQVQDTLPDAAADAIIRALTVVDNPYRPQP